ncbi:MAG: GNAT family N-acetyltransferase [Cyclobacteriaceae bacterium]|nr:GNAT family N-acetyltransferase [Cyclobacteriaceae bacterium]
MIQDIDSLKTEWQRGIVIKTDRNGQIIGSVRAYLIDNVCKIGKLIVKSDFQNQGVGKKLMKEIERLFKTCSTYELFTGEKSDKNLKLIYLQKRNNAVA